MNDSHSARDGDAAPTPDVDPVDATPVEVTPVAANPVAADPVAAAPIPDVGAPPPGPDPYEGAVPPGYDWPTHGGYLGCLIGLMASCLIGGFAAKLVGLYTYYHQITGVANVVVLVAVIALATIICTNLGWRLGRRFFREYAQKPTWGESDALDPTPATPAVAALQASRASLVDDETPDDNRAG